MTQGEKTDALEARASAAEGRLLHTLDALAERRKRLSETWQAARAAAHATKLALLALGTIGAAGLLTALRPRRLLTRQHERGLSFGALFLLGVSGALLVTNALRDRSTVSR